MRIAQFLTITVFLTTAMMLNVFAGDMDMPPYQGSADFERMKNLVGTWEGTQKMGEEEQKLVVKYRLTSNGSAIVEKLFAGSPMEMVSVYYDKNGKLAMTHYCALGNQPQMDLTASTDKDLSFELAADSNIDAAQEMHMHALAISFLDNNHIVQKWLSYKDGKPMLKEQHAFDLTRAQESQ